MHIRLTTFASLSVSLALAACAAPMPDSDAFTDLSPEARTWEDSAGLEMRDIEDETLELRDLESRDVLDDDLFEERDIDEDLHELALREFFEELQERGLFGFGLRKQPKTATFKTPSGTYTGDEVNKAAKDTLKKVQEGRKEAGYPKPGSGFRNSEARHDPTRGKGQSFHTPLRKKGAPYPGPDRVIVNKKPGSTKFTSHVAFHDPKKPVPKGTGAKSNPFSGGKQKFNGKGRGKK